MRSHGLGTIHLGHIRRVFLFLYPSLLLQRSSNQSRRANGVVLDACGFFLFFYLLPVFVSSSVCRRNEMTLLTPVSYMQPSRTMQWSHRNDWENSGEIVEARLRSHALFGSRFIRRINGKKKTIRREWCRKMTFFVRSTHNAELWRCFPLRRPNDHFVTRVICCRFARDGMNA